MRRQKWSLQSEDRAGTCPGSLAEAVALGLQSPVPPEQWPLPSEALLSREGHSSVAHHGRLPALLLAKGTVNL